MKYLLDTNTCIRYINGRSQSIREKLPTVPVAEVAVSVITQAELFYGSAKSQTPLRSRRKQIDFLAPITILDFDSKATFIYGDIRAHLEQQGTPIGANDMLIAAHALSRSLILVTHNIREFERVPNLQLEDWE